tara:strand:+ start:207 stop:434 length:228 start_codon:yes stop_codon:yes gene_type:complete
VEEVKEPFQVQEVNLEDLVVEVKVETQQDQQEQVMQGDLILLKVMLEALEVFHHHHHRDKLVLVEVEQLLLVVQL